MSRARRDRGRMRVRSGGSNGMRRNQSSSKKPDHEENENGNYRDVRDMQPGLTVMFDWQQVPRVKIRAIALHGVAPFPLRVPKTKDTPNETCSRRPCCVASDGASEIQFVPDSLDVS